MARRVERDEPTVKGCRFPWSLEQPIYPNGEAVARRVFIHHLITQMLGWRSSEELLGEEFLDSVRLCLSDPVRVKDLSCEVLDLRI